MEGFANYRLTNGEIMHAFAWRSVALLVEKGEVEQGGTGAPLALGTRRDPLALIFEICDPTWRWQNDAWLKMAPNFENGTNLDDDTALEKSPPRHARWLGARLRSSEGSLS